VVWIPVTPEVPAPASLFARAAISEGVSPRCCSCGIANAAVAVHAVAACGSTNNQAELFATYARGAVAPAITATLPLDRATEAITRLQDRSAMGKMVVTV
jgi:hypothetical protein